MTVSMIIEDSNLPQSKINDILYHIKTILLAKIAR